MVKFNLYGVFALLLFGGIVTSDLKAETKKTKIVCQNKKCKKKFIPENNKVKWTKSVTIGASVGAASGAGVGAYVGTGVGVATGGTGFAAWPITTGVGGLFGGIIGAVSGAWYADIRVMCPHCKTVFENPKNKSKK